MGYKVSDKYRRVSLAIHPSNLKRFTGLRELILNPLEMESFDLRYRKYLLLYKQR